MDSTDPQDAISQHFQVSATLLQDELRRVLTAVAPGDVDAAAAAISSAKRIFLTGAGRSKLALEMAAMRLMHLGLQVHVAGEVTAPAIGAGDLLITASASGTTASVLHAAQVARDAGAKLLVLTTAPQSSLAQIASTVVVLQAAAKTDTGERASRQYAGSLFEQAVLLWCDSLFHSLWQSGEQSSEELLRRHANLE